MAYRKPFQFEDLEIDGDFKLENLQMAWPDFAVLVGAQKHTLGFKVDRWGSKDFVLKPEEADGKALMQILPPALARHEPFALTPAEEETALRNAFLATSKRAWILPGLDWDPVTGQSPEQQQHAILAANGAAFAIEHGLPMGAALSADQQSLMTAPMLWYVETDGSLFPWVYLPDDWQSRLVAVPGGELGAAVAIALTGGRIDNTGFVLTDGALAPVFDPVSSLVYSAGREHVADVWIDGHHVVNKRHLESQSAAMLVSEVVARTSVWQNRISEILS